MRLCDVYAGVIQALSSAGDTRRAASVATEALTIVDGLAADDAARILRLAADCTFLVGGLESGLDLLDRAIDLHETLPVSADYARALERRAGHLRALGRYAEAAASVTLAIAVARRVDDLRLLRGMIAILAWHEHLAGEPATAMALARQALDIRVPEPDPRGDINVAVFVTDLLLTSRGRPARDPRRRPQRAAGRCGLGHLGLRQRPAALATSPRGGCAPAASEWAAELIDPRTAGPVTLDSWPIHVSRGLLDVFRGNTEAAKVRLRPAGARGRRSTSPIAPRS